MEKWIKDYNIETKSFVSTLSRYLAKRIKEQSSVTIFFIYKKLLLIFKKGLQALEDDTFLEMFLHFYTFNNENYFSDNA